MAYKIIYDKNSCIGAGECEVLSENFWKVNGEGTADLKGAILNEDTGDYELEISDEEFKKQEIVAGSCPVGCIRIKKL